MTEFPMVNALLFAGLGVIVFLAAFTLAIRVLPFDLKRQIVEERNMAAAILAAALVLGMAWIIAATMH